MIGIYDYTVVLTLLSVVSAIVGMTAAMQDHFRLAIVLLAVCGLLDTFDGKVARTKKNRTDDEKMYGIQLDSLADVVSFGVFPALICHLMGMREVYDIAILAVYAVCGVIRLAYFNVLEANRQQNPEAGEKVFHGLPITSISVILPITFVASIWLSPAAMIIVLRVVMILMALLFVLDFKMKKPENWHIAVMIVVVAIASIAVLLLSRYKLPHDQAPEEPLLEMEEISELLGEEE